MERWFRMPRRRVTLLVLALLSSLLLTAGAVRGGPERRQFDLEVRATVTVVVDPGAGMADVNDDGRVDGEDLALVARYLGWGPPLDPRADADGDQRVDVRDLALVGSHVRR